MQKLLVFQQNKSGEMKIVGIEKYGKDIIDMKIVNIDMALPQVIDDCSEFLSDEFDKINGDLILDYLEHPDLSVELEALSMKKGIPLVASGKKTKGKNIFAPPTCCGLSRHNSLGEYGKMFGAPEFEVRIDNGIVTKIKVKRGAPCGATWDAAQKTVGTKYEEAGRIIGLKTQFFCAANPAGWDPLFGKSPVHFAGRVHQKALIKAINNEL